MNVTKHDHDETYSLGTIRIVLTGTSVRNPHNSNVVRIATTTHTVNGILETLNRTIKTTIVRVVDGVQYSTVSATRHYYMTVVCKIPNAVRNPTNRTATRTVTIPTNRPELEIIKKHICLTSCLCCLLITI